MAQRSDISMDQSKLLCAAARTLRQDARILIQESRKAVERSRAVTGEIWSRRTKKPARRK